MVVGPDGHVSEPGGVPVLYVEMSASAGPARLSGRLLPYHGSRQTAGLSRYNSQKLGGWGFPRPVVQTQYFEPGPYQHHGLMDHDHQGFDTRDGRSGTFCRERQRTSVSTAPRLHEGQYEFP